MQKAVLLGLLLATLYVQVLILSNVSVLSLPWTALVIFNFLLSAYCVLKLYGEDEVGKAE